MNKPSPLHIKLGFGWAYEYAKDMPAWYREYLREGEYSCPGGWRCSPQALLEVDKRIAELPKYRKLPEKKKCYYEKLLNRKREGFYSCVDEMLRKKYGMLNLNHQFSSICRAKGQFDALWDDGYWRPETRDYDKVKNMFDYIFEPLIDNLVICDPTPKGRLIHNER